MSNTDDIKEKVRNLLELAADATDDAEGQTAFLLAQKLMAKHKIAEGDVTAKASDVVEVEVIRKGVLYWWDRKLSATIANNFACVSVSDSKAIYFYGYKEDAELARDVYHMAAHHMSQRGKYYELSGKALVYYRKGFIVGLMDKFDEQKQQDESLALAVIVPQEVHKALEDGGITETRKDNVPECGDPIAYLMGYESGKELNTDRKKGIE